MKSIEFRKLRVGDVFRPQPIHGYWQTAPRYEVLEKPEFRGRSKPRSLKERMELGGSSKLFSRFRIKVRDLETNDTHFAEDFGGNKMTLETNE